MATAGFPRSSLLSRRRSCEEETAAVLRVAVEVTVLGSSDARAHPDVDLIFWTAAKKHAFISTMCDMRLVSFSREQIRNDGARAATQHLRTVHVISFHTVKAQC